MTHRRTTVYFDAPYQVSIYEEAIPTPVGDQVMVQTSVSAISAGTELLFYRGQVPSDMAVDSSIAGLHRPVAYPLSYGYSVVGNVIACGPDAPDRLMGQTVFAFQPHTSHFLAHTDDLFPVPTGLAVETAALIPNMETAVNLVMDSRPLVGERVLIFGQGVVGLLTTFLLAQFPLESLVTVDGYAQRNYLSRSLGATHSVMPGELATLAKYNPDLIIELSSSPAALTSALELAGFGTRIVVGSWYGQKPASLPLGGKFHRNRVQIISSQVSTLDGKWQNRWTKARRFGVAWQHLQHVPAAQLITHRFPVSQAAQAYQLLDKRPEHAVQVILTY